MGGWLKIKIPILSDKATVRGFLEQLREILADADFTIEKNLIIIKSRKEEIEFSTPYTMLDLEYDADDIVACLRELQLQEYSETLLDRDGDKPPLLFVFGKNINNRLVYIKLKIKGEATKTILCLSFHYAKYNMNFPYA